MYWLSSLGNQIPFWLAKFFPDWNLLIFKSEKMERVEPVLILPVWGWAVFKVTNSLLKREYFIISKHHAINIDTR